MEEGIWPTQKFLRDAPMHVLHCRHSLKPRSQA